MNKITQYTQKNQDFIINELQKSIVNEIDKILSTNEGRKILTDLHRGKTLLEKETYLVKLRAILTEAVNKATLSETGYQGSRTACNCGHRGRFVRYDKKWYNMLTGRVKLSRAFYQCFSCGRGWHPLDSDWELPAGHNSEGIQRIASLVGAFMPFEQAAQVLWETSGITLSDSAIRAIAESTGAKMETIITAEIEKSMAGKPQEPKAEILVVAADGTTVNTREEQWKEVKVGAVASYRRINEKEIKPDQISYTAHLGSVENFRPRLWAEAFRRGEKGKEATIFLGDGSPWVWNLADELFPEAIKVLDYYHLSENVWKAAHVIFHEEQPKKSWVEEITTMLRTGKTEETIIALKNFPANSKETQQALAALLGYINNNRYRINYPELEKKGYPIGSGVVESACKRIVGTRLKQSGMRWSRTGAQKMLNLVCFMRSKRWDEYWKLLHKTA